MATISIKTIFCCFILDINSIFLTRKSLCFQSIQSPYNFLSRNYFFSHLSAALIDHMHRPQEQKACFIHVCFACSRWSIAFVEWNSIQTLTTAVPSKGSCQWRVRRHCEHPLLSWTAAEIPQVLLGIAGPFASMLTGPRCYGFQLLFRVVAMSNLMGNQTSTLYFFIFLSIVMDFQWYSQE